MGNLNTAIRYIPSAGRNVEVRDLSRKFLRKDNAEFLAAVAADLKGKARKPAYGPYLDPEGRGCIGLIGEYGLIGYTIRRAQELIRVDHAPSYWSHAYLHAGGLSTDARVNRDPARSPWIWESTLEPATLFNRFTDRNGVGPRRFADYARAEFDLLAPHSVPNIAVLAIGMTGEERKAILSRADDPDVDQLNYDIAGLLGVWYQYVTNRAEERNPLGAGTAIFCSAYVQLAFDAAGIDLAPGAHQRNTAPEHLWQTARYLGSRVSKVPPSSTAAEARRAPRGARTRRAVTPLADRPVLGWYCIRDKACVLAPVDLDDTQKAPRRLTDVMALADARGRGRRR